MTITEFVNDTWTEWKYMNESKLWRYYEAYMLRVNTIDDKVFENKIEFEKYKLQQGDVILLAMNKETFGEISLLTIADIKPIKGVGKAILKQVEELLGEKFTYNQLEEVVGQIKGLGATTLNRIKEEL
jgi:hypothetical protein